MTLVQKVRESEPSQQLPTDAEQRTGVLYVPWPFTSTDDMRSLKVVFSAERSRLERRVSSPRWVASSLMRTITSSISGAPVGCGAATASSGVMGLPCRGGNNATNVQRYA